MAQNDTGSPDPRPDGDPSTPASFRASKRPRLRGDSQASGRPTLSGSSTPEARRRRSTPGSPAAPGGIDAPSTGSRDTAPTTPPPLPATQHANAQHRSDSPRHSTQVKKRWPRSPKQKAQRARGAAAGAAGAGAAAAGAGAAAGTAPGAARKTAGTAAAAGAAAAAVGGAAAARTASSPRRSARSADPTGASGAARGTSRAAGDTTSRSPRTSGPAPGDSSARSRGTSGAVPLSSSLAAAAREENPSPRRSNRRGDGFPHIVGWTALGTLIPGLGIVQARSSRLGWALFIGFFGVILALIAYVVYRGPLRAASRIVSSPNLLNITAVLLVLAALVWLVVILRTYKEQRRGRALRAGQKTLGAVLVTSLVLCVGIPLAVGASYARVQSDTVAKVFGNTGGPVADKDDLWADTPRINVFLIGRDTGEGREGTRPDTMLVASIDTRSGATTLISVPRNLGLPVFPEGSQLASVFPEGFNAFGYEESMINAVWTWAEEYPDQVGDTGGLEPGMFATMQAVEGSLGLGIDYWASVDMQGFEDVIDAIGGVEIDVERPIPMGGGTNLNTGLKNEIFNWIAPGPQTLDGFQALWYVRSREGSDNYDRMCRQQRMLKTTIDQIDPQEIAVAYPKLAGSAGQNIATSIPQTEVSAFIELAVAMQRSEIKSAQINNDVISTMQPDYDALHAWVQEQVDPQEPSQAEEVSPAPEETTEPAEETTEPTPEETATEEPAPGVEDAAGKCFPQGYTPGDPWPGYPGDQGTGTDAPAGTEQGTGAGVGVGAGQ